ncbi:hypothetical protein ACFLFF_05765 [Brevibacillus reuszeri]
MAIIDLLQSQKNSLLEFIKSENLEPFNFVWEKKLSKFGLGNYVPIIRYKNTEFYFMFDQESGKHYALFSPAEDSIRGEAYPGAWEGQVSRFKDWLKFLYREVTQTDLWAEIHKYQFSDMQFADVENEPFTVPQVEVLTTGVNGIRQYIGQNKLATEEQMVQINKKLDYLIDGTKRQGKKDWLHTCLGVIVSVSVSLALAPEQTEALWQILKNSISGMFQDSKICLKPYMK